MQSSLVCHRNASTAHGMRRILKVLPPVQKYIGQAVRSGIYYKPDEDKNDNSRQQGYNRNRKTRSSPYGTSIQDYPIEYEILSLNPPIPLRPRLPRKLQPRPPKLPTEPLAKKFMKRAAASDSANQYDYYQKLLGVPSSQNSSMQMKASTVYKAHAFAMKQYEVMVEQDMTEDQALEVVNDLLKQQDLQEQQSSRQKTNTIEEEQAAKAIIDNGTDEPHQQQNETTSWQQQDDDDRFSSSVPSVLHSKPRTIDGMEAWSRRLAAVPYKEWTIGATVALDHWIARSVLELTEATWLELLEGNSPTFTSRGRDIIAVRHALFPETMLDRHDDESVHVSAVDLHDEEETTTSSTDKTIDELLASLGAFSNDDDDEEDQFGNQEDEEPDDFDQKVSKLVDELQEWRAKNVETNHDEWSTEDKQEFESWIKRYVATLATSDKDEDEVDLEATLEALLSVPPVTRDENQAFWDHLKDEASAQAWLAEAQELSGSLPKESQRVLSAFMELSLPKQIEKLVELGALEPLLNEYKLESDRVKFLQRHSDKLLEGLEMQHLVEDPNGSVRAEDMGEKWMQAHDIQKDARFSIRVLPYSSGGALSKQEIYGAYTTHKAGRARYEEAMFQQGKLGVRYSDDMNNTDDDAGEEYSLEQEEEDKE